MVTSEQPSPLGWLARNGTKSQQKQLAVFDRRDRIANTIGHYDAYRKIKVIKSSFVFELINPKNIDKKKVIEIYREDSNDLAKRVKCDIAYIDPPYNSRQYSRFYHVYETLIKWDKPELFGVARKPAPENMSDYCSSRAVD